MQGEAAEVRGADMGQDCRGEVERSGVEDSEVRGEGVKLH